MKEINTKDMNAVQGGNGLIKGIVSIILFAITGTLNKDEDPHGKKEPGK